MQMNFNLANIFIIFISLNIINLVQSTTTDDNNLTKPSINFKNFKLTQQYINSEEAKTFNLKYPKPLEEQISVEENQLIKLSFNAKLEQKDETPRFAVAIFNHSLTSELTYVPITRTKANLFKLVLNTKKLPTFLKRKTGAYTLQVMVGGLPNETIVYNLGSLLFNWEAVKTTPPSGFEKLKEITHTFRAPERTPSSLLSYIFSCLVLLPWMLLILGWYSLSVNISGLFASTNHLLIGLTFISHLALLSSLAYLYWKELTIFQTLSYWVPLSISTAFFGRMTLKSVGNH